MRLGTEYDAYRESAAGERWQRILTVGKPLNLLRLRMRELAQSVQAKETIGDAISISV